MLLLELLSPRFIFCHLKKNVKARFPSLSHSSRPPVLRVQQRTHLVHRLEGSSIKVCGLRHAAQEPHGIIQQLMARTRNALNGPYLVAPFGRLRDDGLLRGGVYRE